MQQYPYPRQQVVVAPRSPALGALASFFVPGLGSMIAGRVGKGIAILVCSILAMISTLLVIGFVLAPAVWIWGMVAGFGDMRRWNAKHGIVS
jgi:TM2 domain-containing membrane protein YozV